MPSVLEEFGLSPLVDRDILNSVWGDSNRAADTASPAVVLKQWLSLLPEEITRQLRLALNQEQPFMPADNTPEMMAKLNATVPSMTHIEIIYRCVDCAMKAGDYTMAAALLFLVDRSCFRFGRSAALLNVIDEIMKVSPSTAIAPQIILRKARILKNNGDLYGAMRNLDAVVSRERQWDFKDQTQYENVKAVCVQIKGQILHSLGLWKEAVPPLVESVRSFDILKDYKGLSSSLFLLARCLNKLDTQDYTVLRSGSPDIFQRDHPCFEAYKKCSEASEFVEDLGTTLYVAKHKLVGDESLLMYIIQQNAVMTGRRWFQTIIDEVKQSLAGHRSVQVLHSIESFLEFVRAVFVISLTLTFSPVHQDTHLARFLEKLSMELYRFLCLRSRSDEENEHSTSLSQTKHSVRLMNAALALLGLPPLEGSADFELLDEDESLDDPVAVVTDTTSGESSDPPSQAASASAGDGNDARHQTEPLSHSGAVSSVMGDRSMPATVPAAAKLSDRAATFPAMSARKLGKPAGKASGRNIQQKYVGLPVRKNDLLSATCPAILSEVELDVEDVTPVRDLDCLVPSAETIASVSCNENASGTSSVESGTVDLSSSTKSTSSATDSTGSFPINLSSGSSSFPGSHSAASSSLPASSDPEGSGDSATVDLSADTRSTVSSTSESSDLLGSGSSPLVDLSGSPLCSILADLHLGDSVETNDSAEFLASWMPADDTSVHRAVLWTYNPVTGQWSAQTTLAHLGAKLQTEKEGKFRDAFHVTFLHQDEPLGRYVGKRYRQQRKPEIYMQDVVCQMLAGFYVTRFNQALQHCPEDILQVQFLSAAHLQLCDKNGDVFDWINVEPFLHGSFLKLTNNLQFVSQDQKHEPGVEIATALSHFSYDATGGTLMVVDLQGWMPSDGKGIVYLTDPVFHTKYIKKFSSCDHGEKGMKAFWEKQHPRCNRICCFLGLDKSRPNTAELTE